ncbi:hypothetical protein FRACYDRAFT_229041 [Fragilariopsis cylindrus CCMP1102]|uniref:PRA1 family protein n=1 Tax=Fragilariopsis cylindrus CCMP1102 TaxID=635003 RepID=A0A1E7ESX2_9STRA|nr:hypothetical protein FRACYDRAFT_229041 [Fragilariopsis cylindrus CCMP1102]|eukprot:OEU08945.1 hypothetical protein FRACYDRAFT_229041 [Fragilariopsis cylindrus CCMP1102]
MASNTGPSGSASTLGSLVGVVNSAKEKWDSSGANDAVSKFSASIPDSTKNYISETTGQLFSRERLRTVSVCFGIGEERAFYVEKNPSLLIARIKHNIQFFYLNYLLLSALFFVLTLFVTPSAIIGIALLGAAWAYIIRATQNGSLKIGRALFSSGFLTITYTTFRDASMHQDGNDQVAMVGEVEPAGGEQVAFLGDPHV